MAVNGDDGVTRQAALSGTAMEPGGKGGVQTPALAEDGAGKPGLNAEPTPAEGLGGAPMLAVGRPDVPMEPEGQLEQPKKNRRNRGCMMK